MRQLLGENFSGIVGSDRFSAYHHLSLASRQGCWAHLQRDFTQIAQRRGVAGELGEALLEQQRLLFEQWYRVRDGTLSRKRALRPAVLWRKNSFGSQCEAGSLFVSRMLTVTTSLRAQNRSVLEY